MPNSYTLPLIFKDGRTLPRAIPGPMDGVTEGSFVSVLSRRGYVRSWHTPFVRISTGVPGRSRLRTWLSPYLATGLPVTAQIMGASGERLAATAERLLELGAHCVDLNCACPSPTVIGNGSGGARLRDTVWLADTLRQLRSACGEHPLSVKVRVGYESPNEFSRVAEALRAGSPDLVIVHYRTVNEMYRPIVNGLERLRQCRKLLDGIAVYGSGDLFTTADCDRMMTETGVDGVAPARGLLRNPRLLQELWGIAEGEFEPLPYLLEIAREADRKAGSNNGFVLRMARPLLKEDNPVYDGLFARLAACRTLDATMSFLTSLIGETPHG